MDLFHTLVQQATHQTPDILIANFRIAAAIIATFFRSVGTS